MKIAACAICKNEEKNIPRWLEHTADFDCRIVVDTGSTDSSVKLLKAAGVPVVEKKFEPFRFDEARNSVLELVPQDIDWLIWPDFDEYYNKNWRYEMERVVSAYPWVTRLTYQTFQQENGEMKEGLEAGTTMDSKIHRSGMYRWDKPVHEHLEWIGEGEEAVKYVTGIMRHHLHEPRKERTEQYFNIAKQALEDDPNDAYLIWFVLKEYYYTFKNLEESGKYAERYLEKTSGNTDFRAIARRILAECNEGRPTSSGQSPTTSRRRPTSLIGTSDVGRPKFGFLDAPYRFGARDNSADIIASQNGFSGAAPSSDVRRPKMERTTSINLAAPTLGGRGGSPNAGIPNFPQAGNFPQTEMRDMIRGLIQNKEDAAAVELAKTYLKNIPDDTLIVNEYAGALCRLKQFKKAASIMKGLEHQFPGDSGIAFNLAKCYQGLKRPDDARALLEKLFDKEPRNIDYALDYALYLSGEGRFDESEKILRGLPLSPRTSFNLGWYEMRKGNFMEGFKLRDLGRSEHLWGSEHVTILPKAKRYAGESLQGKKVLLFYEGGLGDEIIFSRFTPMIKERGAGRVVVGCSPQLIDVFKRAFADTVDEVLPMSEAKQREYDCYIPMMNTPNLLSIDSPMVGMPYLKPDPARVAFWKKKLDAIAGGKPKIGIRWAGNPKFEHEQFRSIHPRLFMDFSRYGQLFSVQRDYGAMQLPHNFGVYDLRKYLTDWDETLAILANLDVLISSCTSVVHAAGAIGTPTCVIVPIASYFTWATPGGKSDWYPSVTVFRQEKLRSWREPIQKLHEHIKGQTLLKN